MEIGLGCDAGLMIVLLGYDADARYLTQRISPSRRSHGVGVSAAMTHVASPMSQICCRK